ncbi:MAG: hypothetical protein ABIJ86_06970 [Spirochaetota bacterium]
MFAHGFQYQAFEFRGLRRHCRIEDGTGRGCRRESASYDGERVFGAPAARSCDASSMSTAELSSRSPPRSTPSAVACLPCIASADAGSLLIEPASP